MKPHFANRCSLRNHCKDKEVFRINKKKLALFSKIYGLQDETNGFIAQNTPFSVHDKMPAYFDEKVGMNSPKDAGFLFIHAYVFLPIQRESFSIFVGLISDSRLFEWLVLPIYNRYPISDLFLYPSHTVLSLLYSAISCEGCERRLYIRTFGLPQKYQKFKIVFVLLP